MKQKIKLFSVRLRYVYMCDQTSPILKLRAIFNCILTRSRRSLFTKHLLTLKRGKILQWVETNPSNICIFPTDIHFYPGSWYYTNVKYRCLRVLDGLVSTHPKFDNKNFKACNRTLEGSTTLSITTLSIMTFNKTINKTRHSC